MTATSIQVPDNYYADMVNAAKKKTTRNATDTLDKNAFLLLLVTQMSNQDPLDPMDNSEYIAQLAQFSVLEEMENMNAVTMQSQGLSLVGKTVIASKTDDDGTSYIAGTVDSVVFQSGSTYLNVGGEVINIDNVKEIFDIPQTGTLPDAGESDGGEEK